jgi:HK97 family phage major capsid protein
MPAQTDAMIARFEAEMEERNALIEGCIAAAQDAGRDLNSQEMEMIGAARDRNGKIIAQLEPLREASKIAIESRKRTRDLNAELESARTRLGQPGNVEYRSAGQYVADKYLAMMGDEGAQNRTEVFHRVAAHQTLADNPGLLPESIVGPIVNFVDGSRPIVSTVGPTDLGTGSWAYAKVTQHSQVDVQSAEKAEMASRKMTITKTAITAPTYGGYVNVSRQDISRTSPAILDMVINDLATQYAIQTEAACATAMTTAATTGPIIPVTPTAANVATAIYGAAGSVFTATQGQGRIVIALSADQLGIVAPLFPGVNPQNAFSTGLPAGDLAFGPVGAVSGLSVVLSAGLATDTILVFSTSAVRCFEARYGALQVVEPSVWGVQVGYAGDFQTVVVQATGVVRVTTA